MGDNKLPREIRREREAVVTDARLEALVPRPRVVAPPVTVDGHPVSWAVVAQPTAKLQLLAPWQLVPCSTIMAKRDTVCYAFSATQEADPGAYLLITGL